MSQNPGGWDPFGNGAGDGPSFEEIARALQNMMSGQGDLDPEMAAQLGLPSDPAVLRSMMAQAQSMFVNASNPEGAWDRAREAARQLASADVSAAPALEADQSREAAAIKDAFSLAGLWLDEVTEFETPPVAARAYSPRQWVEASFASFREMTTPMAGSVTAAIKEAMESQVPEEMKAMMGTASSMLDGMGQSLFAMQLGQAVGTLSQEILSTSDIGIAMIDDKPAKALASILLWGSDDKWDWSRQFDEVTHYLTSNMIERCDKDGRPAPQACKHSLAELARLMARMVLHFELYSLWDVYTVKGRLRYSGIEVKASTYTNSWLTYQRQMIHDLYDLLGKADLSIGEYRAGLNRTECDKA